MKAVIYNPPKNVMQSGRGKEDVWVLEYNEDTRNKPETLMGWTSANNTLGQVRMRFSSLKQAQAYAQSKGLDFIVEPRSKRKVRPRNYTDNFKYIPPEDA